MFDCMDCMSLTNYAVARASGECGTPYSHEVCKLPEIPVRTVCEAVDWREWIQSTLQSQQSNLKKFHDVGI